MAWDAKMKLRSVFDNTKHIFFHERGQVTTTVGLQSQQKEVNLLFLAVSISSR